MSSFVFRVFLDSDVVVSSLLSKKGASRVLIFKTPILASQLYISNMSKKELKKVSMRLKIFESDLNGVLKRLKSINIGKDNNVLKRKYGKYVTDPNDAHIVGGAVQSRSKFLVTYNQKHYKTEVIKRELGIIILPPGKLLQYLGLIN